MLNKSMERKLKTGDCVDISRCVRLAVYDQKTSTTHPVYFDYLLEIFVENVDYCDAEKEVWIWSVGKHKKTGKIVASTSTRYYLHEDYECLFLR